MLKNDQMIQAALAIRNMALSDFWLSEPSSRERNDHDLLGLIVTLIDAEDTFTKMIALQLRALGMLVTIRQFNEPGLLDENSDLIVMGPGPGDPGNMSDIRISTMRNLVEKLLKYKRSFIAICLSHQILCLELGLKLSRRNPPNQCVRREIDFFGKPEYVGFYNTYAANYDEMKAAILEQQSITVSWDNVTNEIHGLRGSHFASIQFHAESLLTKNGIDIFSFMIKKALNI